MYAVSSQQFDLVFNPIRADRGLGQLVQELVRHELQRERFGGRRELHLPKLIGGGLRPPAVRHADPPHREGGAEELQVLGRCVPIVLMQLETNQVLFYSRLMDISFQPTAHIPAAPRVGRAAVAASAGQQRAGIDVRARPIPRERQAIPATRNQQRESVTASRQRPTSTKSGCFKIRSAPRVVPLLCFDRAHLESHAADKHDPTEHQHHDQPRVQLMRPRRRRRDTTAAVAAPGFASTVSQK